MAAPVGLTVVVAPDSFKGSLPASEAAAAIDAGLRDAVSGPLETILRPVADGGEGTVAMVLAAGWGRREHLVTGPTGGPVTAAFALSPATSAMRVAVVELASASGLTLLPDGRPDPLGASTRGTGELVAAALDERVDRIVLGIGGSATTDGGTGMASALGARFLDASHTELPAGGAALTGLARIDASGLDPRLRTTEVVLAVDVDNPLTGPAGAAAVYAPQKGASPQDVVLLDAGLSRLAEVLRRDFDVDIESLPGTGAAGGVGACAVALCGASLTPGIDLLLDLVGFDAALSGASLVITGEGSFDHQSLSGKAPVGVARRARTAGVPVLVLAGRVDLAPDDRDQLAALGVTGIHALLDLEPEPDESIRRAAALLRELSARAVNDLYTTRSTA